MGPWLREDYRSFQRLCIHALRLEPDPELPPALEEYLENVRWNPFSDVAAAEAALRKHTIYGWFKKHIPRAVDTEWDETLFAQFRRLHVLVKYIPRLLLPPAEPARRNRLRKAAVDDIQQVQKSMDNGTLSFENPAREAMLQDLLAEATQILQRPLQRMPRPELPLKELACELHKQTGHVGKQLLLEVVKERGLDCKESTIDRYIRDIQKDSPTATD